VCVRALARVCVLASVCVSVCVCKCFRVRSCACVCVCVRVRAWPTPFRVAHLLRVEARAVERSLSAKSAG
jgi:hypothetical protein